MFGTISDEKETEMNATKRAIEMNGTTKDMFGDLEAKTTGELFGLADILIAVRMPQNQKDVLRREISRILDRRRPPKYSGTECGFIS